MGTDWRSENDVWGLTNTTVNHSFQTFLRYGWMDKRFINPIWEIVVFQKNIAIIFRPKTNMQDEVGVTKVWLTTSCGL